MSAAQQPLSPEVHHIALRPPADLLELALQNNAAIDVIERLAALRRDERNYQAQVAFDEALNRCQAKLGRIAADAHNSNTNSRYATYAKLDAVVRPIYTAEGFSLSFGETDCPTPGKTRFVAALSRAGVTREKFKDMSPSTKGPKGGDVMTPIHADASADSYAKRYLLKNWFNIAIGDDDSDGNPEPKTESSTVDGWCVKLSKAQSYEQVQQLFRAAYTEASKAQDQRFQAALIAAKDARIKELRREHADL